jgi:hypothetical protein
MLAWSLVAVGLYRRLGPRRALLITVVGGNLLLPTLVFDVLSESRIQFLQAGAIGLAVVLGVVLGDRRALGRIRLDWLDLPMLAYVLYPLSGLITQGPIAAWDVADIILQRVLGVVVPYAAARYYLADAEGAKATLVAIVIATLFYAPVVVLEAVLGPQVYVGRLFGAAPVEALDYRLGGWRPQGLFLNGLILATWMALAAVVAFWVALGRSWPSRWGPSWWPALVLVGISVGCRGVYGYIVLGAGLVAAAATRLLRTRAAIALCLVVIPLYMGLRLTGAWDARLLTQTAARTGRGWTVEFRLRAEDAIIERVMTRRPILGYGVEIWHALKIHEDLGEYWPDGQWLISLWTGGLLGLAFELAALALVPTAVALMAAKPPWRDLGHRSTAGGWAILGLALFVVLCLLDGLHNHGHYTPRVLAAGTLIGIGVNRRRGTAEPRVVHANVQATPPRTAVDLSLIPIVTAAACLLYVFARARVEGYSGVKIAGGLGAALLYAAAGAVGAWAVTLFSIARLATFAALFAILGLSFNLALHARSNPVATADIFQGLALCGLTVGCWRRWCGAWIGADAAFMACALVIHLLFRDSLPTFPGSQYLYAGATGERSLFPLFPWVTMALLGARAAAGSAVASSVLATLFAALTALAWWAEPGPDRLTKYPVDLSYALLSYSAIEAVFALAHRLKRLKTVARPMQWLGRRWMIFFYLLFPIETAVGALRAGSAGLIWTLQAAGTIAATWLVAQASAPLVRVFQSPAAWTLPLLLCAVAGAAPGLPPVAINALAGLAGLIFAAYHESLAYLVINQPRLGPGLGPTPTRPLGDRRRGLVRVAVVAALLALPELAGLLSPPAAAPALPAPAVSDRVEAPQQSDTVKPAPFVIPVPDP